ncbi:hypothetical protein EJB05_26684, partial [Eragrostis curvula]
MNACPQWKSLLSVAKFVGSGGPGLGFYHVDVPAEETTQWLNFKNCGVVNVIAGEVDITEMEMELSAIFCKEWPWQIRELDKGQFLVRFPPHKKVADIKNLPSFNLRKEGVRVEVNEWIGELDPFEELQEVWVQVSGIPPKWCAWSVFAQVTSSFGLITDVEWSSLFKSFYGWVRIKVACRDPEKIPLDRFFEMDKKLYRVYFDVEEVSQVAGDNDTKGDDDQGGDDKDEDFDGLGDNTQGKPMDTDGNQSGTAANQKSTTTPKYNTMPKGSKTVGLQQTQEKEVEIFLSGEEFYSQEKEVLITAKQDGKENSVHSEERSDQLGTMDTNEKQLFPQKDEAETSQQSRWLEFMQEEDGKVSASRCAELLRSMDLMQSESEPDEDEGEKSVMPKELIEQWTAKRNLFNELNECAEEKEDKQQKKPKLEKKWGPIIPCRKSSRNAGDGRTVLERAQSNIKRKNLEQPVKNGKSNVNSFAALDTDYLANVAKKVNLRMGDDMPDVLNNIDTIKEQESKKLENFLSDNPEVLLPESIESIFVNDIDVPSSSDGFKNHKVDDDGWIEGAKWEKIQVLEMMVAKKLRSWKILAKDENVQRMIDSSERWQKQAMEKPAICVQEWWTARQSGAPGERAINDDISSETVVSQMSYSGVVVNADRQCDANYAVTMDGLSAV